MFFELVVDRVLGNHEKPIGVLNATGFYDNMVGVCRQLIDKKFARDNILKSHFFYVERDPLVLFKAVTKGLSAAYDSNMHLYVVKPNIMNPTDFVVMELLDDWEKNEESAWLDERFTKMAITTKGKSK